MFLIDTVIMLAELCVFLQILGLVLLVCVSYARVHIIVCITVQSVLLLDADLQESVIQDCHHMSDRLILTSTPDI